MTGNLTTTALPVPAPQPPRQTEARATLRSLQHALLALDDERQALAAEGDYEALLAGLLSMRTLTRDLQVLARATEADAARLLESVPREGRARRWAMEGLGLVEMKNTYPSRPWDTAALVPALVRAALDPEGTGEVPAMTATEVAALVATALSDCARLEWRTGDPIKGQPGLRTYGLDPNQYRAEPGDPTPAITITPTKD
jgi:hypothetical protein